MDFRKRKPLAPEATDLHGPGIDFWRDLTEDNHFSKTDDAVLRGRTDAAQRFVENLRPIVDKLVSSKKS